VRRRRGLAFFHIGASRVDDLHTTVLIGERIALILEVLLAEHMAEEAHDRRGRSGSEALD